MLKYIELKSGHGDSGPAWIARVRLSKSGRTIYFNGKALKRSGGQGISGNHYDLATGDEYWVSGVKKDGTDRHWAGSGSIMIEASAVSEYLEFTGHSELDRRQFRAIPDLPPTDPASFRDREHRQL